METQHSQLILYVPSTCLKVMFRFSGYVGENNTISLNGNGQPAEPYAQLTSPIICVWLTVPGRKHGLMASPMETVRMMAKADSITLPVALILVANSPTITARASLARISWILNLMGSVRLVYLG